MDSMTPKRESVVAVQSASRTRSIRRSIAWCVAVITLAGMVFYLAALRSDGVNTFEWISLTLYTVLFGWIALSFCVATLGFFRRIKNVSATRKMSVGKTTESCDQSQDAAKRCAVLVPVYNESPVDVFARIEAMTDSLTERSAQQDFDFFVLSDSTDAETRLSEELVWSSVIKRIDAKANVFYRHRKFNVGRKAGNIADFCQRWGSPYELMIVLDADSLLTAQTMIEMVRRMRADDKIGILQVAPVPIGRSSLFARLQQFSAAAYGTIFVEGFAAWAGHQGNYWGHNAIIRVHAFREFCGLPVLPGKEPFGGEILSHDFVEAALMVKHGWKVVLASDMGGSYEECPTTLSDYAQRDQRWCQGNLQHSRLIVSDGFRGASRFHFLSGVMAYASSPIWILFVLTCLAGWAADQYSAGQISGVNERIPAFMSVNMIRMGLFAAAMMMLIIPKLYSVVTIVCEGRARQFGGIVALVVSAVCETVWSVLISPVMALLHTRFVLGAILGRSVRWSAQQRGEHGISMGCAARQYGGMTLIGIVGASAIWLFAPSLLAWFSPVLIGLVLSIPIAMITGSSSLGRSFQKARLLLIPQETERSEIQINFDTAFSRLNDDVASSGSTHRTNFERVISDPGFFLLHQRLLQAGESVEALSNDQRDLVRSSMKGDVDRIPVNLRSRLLNDDAFLQELHRETHLGLSTVT